MCYVIIVMFLGDSYVGLKSRCMFLKIRKVMIVIKLFELKLHWASQLLVVSLFEDKNKLFFFLL